MRIRVGQAVHRENTYVIVHTVTADPEKATMEKSVRLPEGGSPFDSWTLDPDATSEHTFEVRGTCRYFCIPHVGTRMYGNVIVDSDTR